MWELKTSPKKNCFGENKTAMIYRMENPMVQVHDENHHTHKKNMSYFRRFWVKETFSPKKGIPLSYHASNVAFQTRCRKRFPTAPECIK